MKQRIAERVVIVWQLRSYPVSAIMLELAKRRIEVSSRTIYRDLERVKKIPQISVVCDTQHVNMEFDVRPEAVKN